MTIYRVFIVALGVWVVFRTIARTLGALRESLKESKSRGFGEEYTDAVGCLFSIFGAIAIVSYFTWVTFGYFILVKFAWDM